MTVRDYIIALILIFLSGTNSLKSQQFLWRTSRLINQKCTELYSSCLPIQSLLNDLTKVTVILASASPRRKELLQNNIGLTNLVVLASGFDELLDKGSFRCATDYCSATARAKALDLINSGKAPVDASKQQILISADTIVVVSCHDEILEKPKDKADASRMLSLLSGKQHTVHTAVAIYTSLPGQTEYTAGSEFVESSLVKFIELTQADIDAYISTGECWDKSGSYGIQQFGSLLVRSITGCYFNIMGLPVSRVSKELAKIFVV